MSIVRLALVQSVTNRAPFVSLHVSHVSTVPMRREPVFAAAFASAQLSNSQRIFVPAKYVLIGKPQVSRSASLPPRSRSRSAQICDVRVSSHTMALCSGFPDSASHATTVSRWFVMPTHATSAAVAPPGTLASALDMHSCAFATISSGSCSHQPGWGKICLCSI